MTRASYHLDLIASLHTSYAYHNPGCTRAAFQRRLGTFTRLSPSRIALALRIRNAPLSRLDISAWVNYEFARAPIVYLLCGGGENSSNFQLARRRRLVPIEPLLSPGIPGISGAAAEWLRAPSCRWYRRFGGLAQHCCLCFNLFRVFGSLRFEIYQVGRIRQFSDLIWWKECEVLCCEVEVHGKC